MFLLLNVPTWNLTDDFRVQMTFSDEPSTKSFGGYKERSPAMVQQMKEFLLVKMSLFKAHYNA